MCVYTKYRVVMIAKYNKRYAAGAASGFLVGAANGLFGGGGGMIAVPLLQGALGFSDKCAHATAILIIAPVSLASAVIYIIKGFAIAELVIAVSVGATFGGLIGAQLLGALPKKAVNIIFIAVMFAAGARMLFG